MGTNDKIIVANLQKMATDRGMSLVEAAGRAGITKDTVATWLRFTAVPTEGDIKKIEDTLGTKMEEITINKKPAAQPKTSSTPKKRTKKIPEKNTLSDALDATVAQKTATQKDSDDIPGQVSIEDVLPKPIEQDPSEVESRRVRTSKREKNAAIKRINETAKDYIVTESTPKTKAEIKAQMTELRKNVIAGLDEMEKYAIRLGDEKLTAEKELSVRPAIDPKFKALIKAAEEASDEGIEMAVKILRKWKR